MSQEKIQHNNILLAIAGFALVVIIVALIGFFALGRDSTEIPFGGRSFFLKDVPAADRRAEVGFAIDERTVLGEALPALGGRPRGRRRGTRRRRLLLRG